MCLYSLSINCAAFSMPGVKVALPCISSADKVLIMRSTSSCLIILSTFCAKLTDDIANKAIALINFFISLLLIASYYGNLFVIWSVLFLLFRKSPRLGMGFLQVHWLF